MGGRKTGPKINCPTKRELRSKKNSAANTNPQGTRDLITVHQRAYRWLCIDDHITSHEVAGLLGRKKNIRIPHFIIMLRIALYGGWRIWKVWGT